MSTTSRKTALSAIDAAPRAKSSILPEPLASRLAGREKKPLGEVFGLMNFGVNLTRLMPGAVSSFRHWHSRQDEFIYILQGAPLLHTEEGQQRLAPGMCAGFKAGIDNGHRLINDTADEVRYLEIGDRSDGDTVQYPDDDLSAIMEGGQWKFMHKDGTPY